MPETTRDDVESGLMGLTLVFARLNETTPERQMAAPTSARLAEERKLAGNLTSRAGVADEAHHISAATMTPSATGVSGVNYFSRRDAAHLTRTFYQMVGMAPSVLMRGKFAEIGSPFFGSADNAAAAPVPGPPIR
jgi:hypothetical protein